MMHGTLSLPEPTLGNQINCASFILSALGFSAGDECFRIDCVLTTPLGTVIGMGAKENEIDLFGVVLSADWEVSSVSITSPSSGSSLTGEFASLTVVWLG